MGAINPGGVGVTQSLPLLQFQVSAIMLSELYALSNTGVWENIEKPMYDMAFLLIALDKTIKRERVFGLVAVWVHLQQACHHSLGEAAHKLTLLIDIGTNLVYTFAWLNEGALHTPLSSEGHMSAMIYFMPSINACGYLSQLEVHKLLQCGDQVVFPGGLNGGLESMWFTFPELPVWNTATPSQPTCEPLLLQVNLSSMKPRDETPIGLVPLIASMPLSSMQHAMEHPSEIATSMTVELQELLLQAMPNTSDPVPGHPAPRRLPSVTLGFWPLTEEEGSQQSERIDSATPALAVTLMPGDDPCTSTITSASPVSPAPKTIQVVSVSPVCQPKISLWPKLAELSEELLQLQEKLTAALEYLLTVRGAVDLRWQELDLQVELSKHLNDA